MIRSHLKSKLFCFLQLSLYLSTTPKKKLLKVQLLISLQKLAVKDFFFSRDFCSIFLFRCVADDDMVIDKWFTTQTKADYENVLNYVKELKKHALFNSIPNRVRSLLLSFTMNPRFHEIDGEGYKFVSDSIMELDNTNPLLAADLAKKLASWKMLSSIK